MDYVSLAFAVLYLLFYSYGEESKLIRKTQYGLIQGALTRSEVDPTIEFYSFKAIPFAHPPIGKLRFQEPLPPKPWLGIRDASRSANICVQISDNFMGTDVVGNEDCLYLEIFEPKTARSSEKELMPVLVWFHGGTFIFGTAIHNGPDFFMEKPIVVVAVEYRVNVFGFLSTKDENAKGNCGLKDQALALQWIRENIANFGGDPNKVTIAGSSAGGASVQYHMLSPRSHQLFQRAISQGGSSFNRWALQENPLEMIHRLAKGLGVHKTESKHLIEELQKIDYRIIMKTAFNESVVGFYTPYYAQPFAPIIESESSTAFISESTFTTLQKGKVYNKVPYIIGFNTEEGSFAYDYINNSRIDIKIYESNPELFIPIAMNTSKESDCRDKSLKQIIDFYFNNGSVTDKKNWINYMSQDLFVRGIIKSTKFLFNLIPVYLYRFSYTGSNPISYLGGVGHHEEGQYIWREPLNMSESDMLTSKRMITLWTNFAQTGNPTPEADELLQNVIWPQVDTSTSFLDIGNNLILLKNHEEEHYKFWEQLFGSCGNPPYNTY